MMISSKKRRFILKTDKIVGFIRTQKNKVWKSNNKIESFLLRSCIACLNIACTKRWHLILWQCKHLPNLNIILCFDLFNIPNEDAFLVINIDITVWLRIRSIEVDLNATGIIIYKYFWYFYQIQVSS